MEKETILKQKLWKIVCSALITLLLLLTVTSCDMLLGITNPGIQPPIEDNTPRKQANLLLGNPSDAKASLIMKDNYLIEREAFTLSYNGSNFIPNWVSWHLQKSDTGNLERPTRFTADTMVPESWGRVEHNDYTNSGFDRGHICPNADRDGIKSWMYDTFMTTNIVPQAPDNNQKLWKYLEEYTRDLVVDHGYEAYIIAGPAGTGGIGSKGPADFVSEINGKKDILVPEYVWKVIIFLKNGSDDLNRITKDTNIIAVMMPNKQGLQGTDKNPKEWWDYACTVDDIEKVTSLNLLSTLSDDIENALEQKKISGQPDIK